MKAKEESNTAPVPTRCQLSRAIGAPRQSMEIGREDFENVALAKRSLVGAVGLEEKFHLLLENYFEFEQSLLCQTLRRQVFAGGDWGGFQEDILTVNRKLANLLSAARLYFDQIEHSLTSLFGDESEVLIAVRRARQVEYDQRLGYRALEALRNYLQHRGFPVHYLSFNTEAEGTGDARLLAYTIIPKISTAEVQKDGKVKPEVLRELLQQGRLVSLTPLVRDYVEGIAGVHSVLQNGIQESASIWEEAISRMIECGEAALGEDPVGYVASTQNGADSEQEVELFKDLPERRRYLEQKGRYAARLGRCFVSGKATHDKSRA